MAHACSLLLMRPRLEDYCHFKASMGYIMSYTISQEEEKKEGKGMEAMNASKSQSVKVNSFA